MAYAFNDDKSKFDLEETIDNVDNLIGNMATIESSPVTTNHSTGEYIMYNGTLLRVLSPIATGENLVLGTNVTPINFGDEIKDLRDSVSFKAGDTFTFKVDTGGYITNGSNQVCFTIPISKVIVGRATINITKLIVRQNGSYLFGSSGSTSVTTSYTIAEFYVTDSCTSVVVQFASSGGTNNDTCGVVCMGTITVS